MQNKTAVAARSRAFLGLSLFFLTICILFFSFMNIDKLIALYYTHFGNFDVKFEESSGFPLDIIKIKDLRVYSKTGNFSIISKDADFRVLLERSIVFRGLVLRCALYDTRFSMDEVGPGGGATDPLLSIPFRPEFNYKDLSFTLLLSGRQIEVMDIEGISDGIQIDGYFNMVHRTKDMTLKMKMVLSSQLAKDVLGDFREILLTQRDDGYYEATFVFEGNIDEERFHARSDKLEIKIESG